MIKIAGSTQRAFIFPAELAVAYAYYSDLSRILTFLPHISLLRTYAYDRFRVLYSTLELGAYHIHIYCDLQTILDGNEGRVIRVQPFKGAEPVRPQAGLASASAPGHFNIESVFNAIDAHQTKVEYQLQLRAKLPTPLGLRLVPDGVVNSIAESIMEMRIHEIAEGFVETSIEAFPHWLEDMKDQTPGGHAGQS